MFCPNCKTEYRPGFTKCADCGAVLVEHLPEKREEVSNETPDNDALVPVLQTWDRGDVLSIRMALDPAGIEYLIQGETMSGFRKSDPFVLIVKKEDVEQVQELLKDVKLNYSTASFNRNPRE